MAMPPPAAPKPIKHLPTIGVDEVGRGPLAGPVVACALMVTDSNTLPAGLADSKALSRSKREKLSAILCAQFHYALAIVDNHQIDAINILQATFQAMREAVAILLAEYELEAEPNPSISIFIDGNFNPLAKLYNNSQAVIKGDSLIPAISAASIIAKVYRDQLMAELATQYPQYGWERNAGYGTAAHMNAIREYGITPYHRRSFLKSIG